MVALVRYTIAECLEEGWCGLCWLGLWGYRIFVVGDGLVDFRADLVVLVDGEGCDGKVLILERLFGFFLWRGFEEDQLNNIYLHSFNI